MPGKLILRAIPFPEKENPEAEVLNKILVQSEESLQFVSCIIPDFDN